MTAKYQRLDNGAETTAGDSKRGVWYSLACTYWTDEWDTLALIGSQIPCCPHCGSVGFQIDADKWEVPDEYEAAHPGYRDQLSAWKNAPCAPRSATGGG